MNMNNVITIDRFNKLTGQETLHPLVGLADLKGDELPDDLYLPCNFYALLCRQDRQGTRTSLQLINPGELFEIPSARHREARNYTGVLFHPDLLCDTPLENSIDRYPTRCCCHSALTERERQTISDCLREIDKELHHAIDRYSSTIIVSHIELLLNYCTRFCSNPK
ncbi:MAG: transcriptional regulator [Bacteroidales bacterium]|nr:transcriptional regulator [Bacteroidales bacterium]